MILFVYDFEFNLLLAEPGIIRSRWEIYYNDIGTFEAHLPIASELTKIISENPYLVVKQQGMSAIIVGKELGDELVIYGRTCNWLLSKRITPAYPQNTVFAGDTAVEMVTKAFSDVKNFSVGNVITGDSIEFESEEETTFDAVQDCLERSHLGHELCFDVSGKKWEFNILCGKDNELILSEAHRNAYDTKVTWDIIDLATCGVYKQKTDDGFLSATITGDFEKSGIYRWEAKLDGCSEPEAVNSLDKLCEKTRISMSTHDVLWGRDYALGDVVSLQIIKGAYKKTEKRRVIGVEICVDRGVVTQQPVFE